MTKNKVSSRHTNSPEDRLKFVKKMQVKELYGLLLLTIWR